MCCLFLAGGQPRTLSVDSISKLSPQLKTKLDRRCLEDATSAVDDSTTRLLNGISHVYRSTGAGIDRSMDPDDDDDENKNASEAIASQLEEQREQMALDADRAMDSIVFREEDEEEAAVTRKEEDESDAR